MGTEVAEIDSLEKGLLSETGCVDTEDETVIYMASFEDMEEKFVKYQTAQWVLYSLLLILAWGMGLFMLLYVPVRRYILREDIKSRKLFVTQNSIVYKVTKPVPFPCFGVLKKEKHVLLASVADVVIEQGYLQSLFDVYSIRIENVGVRRPPSDDVKIQGISNPKAFRKAVLTRLSQIRNDSYSRQTSAIDDVPSLRLGVSSSTWMSPSKSLKYDSFSYPVDNMILQKLEEVDSSVKRIQSLIKGHHSQKSEIE